MAYDNYSCIKCRFQDGVLFAAIDNPPINLMTLELSSELYRIAGEIAADDDVKVVVFESADPEFFIAHFDVEVLALMGEQQPPVSMELHDLNKTCEIFRCMPKVSMAKLEGRARGGGSEFVLGLDMRFAAIGRAMLGQPEVAIGIIPGGGGTQRLPRLIGQSRALEVVLGCGDLDAETAERYGYVNRALPAEDIGAFVENLAFRMASFPAESIALAKKSVRNAAAMPIVDGLFEETALFARSLALPEARARMKRFLEVGGQTKKGELFIADMYEKLS
ncbi:MAG: enoyl-CoA hydratase/isomerase family protein [Desulfobacterales bacterium]